MAPTQVSFRGGGAERGRQEVGLISIHLTCFKQCYSVMNRTLFQLLVEVVKKIVKYAYGLETALNSRTGDSVNVFPHSIEMHGL